MTSTPPAALNILGVPVTPFESPRAALECIRSRIADGRRTFCVAVNPEKVERARTEPDLQRVLAAADLQLCDGIGVTLAALALYRRRLPRCTGIDLFVELARMAAAEGWKVFLLGGKPESNAGARRKLLEWFPAIRIAGCRDGYFTDSGQVVDEINASGADVLFVALGSPRQEFWITRYAQRLRPAFAMGVGGSFDVLSGSARRAPLLFRRTGTEWLFRLIVQPARIRRQLAYPVFALRVFAELLGGKQKRRDVHAIPPAM